MYGKPHVADTTKAMRRDYSALKRLIILWWYHNADTHTLEWT